ncbi:S41 family peptidase [Mycoplasma sp. OR1901]|uniref:S41 family peptidase n=1 Tax=Mycoplasma sp. OR1901 TaxID=2742195 RepID=UPI001583F35E|nr:S41 family peptidase [Mycoplasma sp. OR1901]QKT05658.1 hypothetical protein HTZ87_03040 [Mycoplasma sp. OR1901]
MKKKYKFITGIIASTFPLIALVSCSNTNNRYNAIKSENISNKQDANNEIPKTTNEVKNKENQEEAKEKDDSITQDIKTQEQDKSIEKDTSNSENQEQNSNDQQNNTNTNYVELENIKSKFSDLINSYSRKSEGYQILKNEAKKIEDSINELINNKVNKENINSEVNKYNLKYELIIKKTSIADSLYNLEIINETIKDNKSKYETINEFDQPISEITDKINEITSFLSKDQNDDTNIETKNLELYNLKTTMINKNKELIRKIQKDHSDIYQYSITKDHANSLLEYLKNIYPDLYSQEVEKINKILNNKSEISSKNNELTTLIKNTNEVINNKQLNNKSNLISQSNTFTNYFEGYNFMDENITTYNKEGEKVIYVGLRDMIYKLDGLFVNKGINIIKNDQVIEYILPNKEKIKIDLNKNTFSATSPDFWNFVKENDSLDPNIHLDFYSSKKIVQSNSEWVEYSLDESGFDFIKLDNEVLIPLPIFNILFANPNYYNLYLNDNHIYGFDTVYNGNSDTKRKIVNLKTNQDLKDREYNFNTLKFLMNNFYGLKDKKFNNKKWEDTLTKYQKDLILSTEIVKNNFGYIDVLQNNLSDRHTVVKNFSFLNQNNSFPFTEYGNQNINFNNSILSSTMLFDQKQNNYSERVNDGSNIYKEGNTAFITTYLFDFKEGNSTFDFYKKSLKTILNDNKNLEESKKIKNIVLDFTSNGGGETISLFKALSFLTNEHVKDYQINKIDNSITLKDYTVDNNENNEFLDNDSFANDFKFYILTSFNTFSAANIMAHIAKENKWATIIGNNSGGGGFSVLPTSLPDGTSLFISSVNGSYTTNKKESEIKSISDLVDVEEGVKPDLKINYKHYYNLEYINNLLNKGNQENNKSDFPNTFDLIKTFSDKSLTEQKERLDAQLNQIKDAVIENNNINIFEFVKTFIETEPLPKTNPFDNKLSEKQRKIKGQIKLLLESLKIPNEFNYDGIDDIYGSFLIIKDENTLELTLLLTNLNESLLSIPLLIKYN